MMDTARFYESLGYDPHPGQLRFHASTARFKVADCGRRWGKSMAGPHDKVPTMFLKKPVLGWIVAPTYDLGEKEFRVFWDILIDKMKVPVDKLKTFYNVRTKDFRITTAWGSSVEVRSAEHPESLVGEGLDWVIMAEAAKLKLSHWEKYIRPTLSDKRGSAVFVSTPEGFNWFYDIWQRGNSKDNPEWWSIQSPTWENTKVFPMGRQDPEMIEVESTNAPEVFDQEYGAKFTSFAGRIYSEFDEGYHVIDKNDWDFHPEWPNYINFDFGYRNPFCCLNIQVDPVDNVYIWNEYYERNLHVPEHARRLKSMVSWRVDGGYYDPPGVDQVGTLLNSFHNSSDYYNPWLANIFLEPAPNAWEAGVSRVKEWLRLGPDQKPKLFVVSSCRNTIREFNTYRVKEQGEKVAESRDPKEEPRKKDDHAMDTIRYFVAGHFGLESHVGYQD